MRSGPHDHQVAFYSSAGELAGTVARYLRTGLDAGARTAVIGTGPHRAAIEAAVGAGTPTDVGPDQVTGGVSLEADRMLHSFMVGDRPQSDRFKRTVGRLVRDLVSRETPLYVYGEMVALLWESGNVLGAMALEDLWNDLSDELGFTLLCAYPTTALGSAELGEVHRMCQQHSEVFTPAAHADTALGEPASGVPGRTGVFLGAPGAVAAARHFVSHTLTAWGQPHLVWDAALIVSELATNAVVHAGSPFRASVTREANVVRIAVEDIGPQLPLHVGMPLDDIRGRGVAIVDELSLRWGVERLLASKVLWAELSATG